MLVIIASNVVDKSSRILLEKLKAGESVSAEDRIGVLKEILDFSPRDWSEDPELWMLYQVIHNNPGDSILPASA